VEVNARVAKAEYPMGKIGRNALCPCGSGKKYKKCCEAKDKALESQPAPLPAGEPWRRSPGSPEPATPLVERLLRDVPSQNLETAEAGAEPEEKYHPYVEAKNFEYTDAFEKLRQRHPVRASRLWTMRRIAELTTEAIGERLRAHGIDPSREAFLELSAETTSAWELGESWCRMSSEVLDSETERFVKLAACVLWTRYSPDRPSKEMLDDWLEEGFDFMEQKKDEEACDRWWKVWQSMKPRLSPSMRKADDAEVILLEGAYYFEGWFPDFIRALLCAGIGKPSYGEKGVQFCEDMLAQFPGEDLPTRLNLMTDLAEFHDLAGRFQEGRTLLLQLIRDYPDYGIAYARLAHLAQWRAENSGPFEEDDPFDYLKEARNLLEEALARPVKDAEYWELEKALGEVRTRLSYAE
jgi:hypothetical protein